MTDFNSHAKAQAIAKLVHAKLAPTLCADDTEHTIANRAAALFASYGIVNTWYHDCIAFVLLGERSCLSISGRDYVPAQERVGQFNVITVDLSPLIGVAWGDCARTFFIENGVYTANPKTAEFLSGMQVESALHEAMHSRVTPDTTFEELFVLGNSEIVRHGYETLDFFGNLGHSIATQLSGRQYIEQGNTARLGSVPMFTFEPHIKRMHGRWGFKHEDIYYFGADRKLRVL